MLQAGQESYAGSMKDPQPPRHSPEQQAEHARQLAVHRSRVQERVSRALPKREPQNRRARLRELRPTRGGGMAEVRVTHDGEQRDEFGHPVPGHYPLRRITAKPNGRLSGRAARVKANKREVYR